MNFVDKVMSLLFNMLSRLVITFLPKSKHLVISWLQSPSAVMGSKITADGDCSHEIIDQIANTRWIMEKAREFQKNICFFDYTKAFDCASQQTGKFFKRWEYHLTCLL